MLVAWRAGSNVEPSRRERRHLERRQQMTAVAGRVNPLEHGIMTLMTKRSIDGGMNRLAAGVLVAALLGSVACVPATAVAEEPGSAAKTPAAAAAQPDAAVLLERARKKIKVDHDVAGAVAAYREVIEKHRADLAHARPALRELIDIWVEVQGNEAAAAAIRPAAEKYLDMQRPIDPKAAAARTDDDLTRDLLLKPWLVTLKFDKAPLKDVLAEITRQSGVAIELGTVPLPFDAARFRAFIEKIPRYAELPEQERKAMQAEAKVMKPDLARDGDPDTLLRESALSLSQLGEDEVDDLIEAYEFERQRFVQAVACEVTINVNGVTALAALDALAASVSMPLTADHSSKKGCVQLTFDAKSLKADRSYHGRTRIEFFEQYSERTSVLTGETRHSTLMVDTDFAAEPGLLVREIHVRSAIGTDRQGRRHVMKEEQNKHRRDCMLFEDVPADVQEFVTISGEVAGTVIADRQEYRLPLAKGSRLETPSGRLTILAVETLDSIRNKEKTRVTVAYRKNRNAAGVRPATGEGLGGLDGDDFQLEMASGERTECSGSQTSWGDEWTVEHMLEWETGSAEPTALVWTVPTKEIAVTIPFEFKNVKLP
jgi:hypothetical protein